MGKVLLQRYKKNPILVPNEANRWESKAVFNCAILHYENKFHMLYRAIGEYERYISRIGYASSTDGYSFTRSNHIALEARLQCTCSSLSMYHIWPIYYLFHSFFSLRVIAPLKASPISEGFYCSHSSRTKFGRRNGCSRISIFNQPCVAPLSSITISTSPSYLGLTASWAGV